MTSLLLLGLLCAAPESSVSTDPLLPAQVYELPEPPQPKRHELFFAPLATAGGLAAGLVAPGGFYVPLGGTFALGPHWGLTAELSASVPFMRNGRTEVPGWAFSTAVGPTFFLAREGLDGFFVTPKLIFQVAQPAESANLPLDTGPSIPLDFGPGISRVVLGALDVGYRWRWRALTVGVVLGAGIGYGYDLHDPLVSPLPYGRNFLRTSGLAYSVNVDLLRVGYAF